MTFNSLLTIIKIQALTFSELSYNQNITQQRKHTMFYFVTGLIGLFAVAGTSDANPDFGIPYILFFGTIATIVMGVGVQKLINDNH